MVAVLLLTALPAAAMAADIGGYLKDQEARKRAQVDAAEAETVMARARDGDPEAQYRLGQAYRNGWGRDKDPVAAMAWLREAADRGLAEAQCALASMYETGEGIPPDLRKARQWYEKAALQGFADAQVGLAALITRHDQTALGEAYMWMEIAAAGGDPDAQRNLGALAQLLSESELAQARELARRFVPEHPVPSER
jgi:TPR repeat protein